MGRVGIPRSGAATVSTRPQRAARDHGRRHAAQPRSITSREAQRERTASSEPQARSGVRTTALTCATSSGEKTARATRARPVLWPMRRSSRNRLRHFATTSGAVSNRAAIPTFVSTCAPRKARSAPAAPSGTAQSAAQRSPQAHRAHRRSAQSHCSWRPYQQIRLTPRSNSRANLRPRSLRERSLPAERLSSRFGGSSKPRASRPSKCSPARRGIVRLIPYVTAKA